jgi:putative hemolysin
MILAAMMVPVWMLAVLAALLLASGFFSGSETALFTLSRCDLDTFRASSRGLERQAARLARRSNRLLNTLLLGNMLVNVAFSAVAASAVLRLERSLAPGRGKGVWLAAVSAAPVLALILFGEVTPKMLAYTVARRWSVLAAGPLTLIQSVALPVLWVLEHGLVGPLMRLVAPHPAEGGRLTGKELAALMDLSARRGVLDRDAGGILREIVELTDVRACDVMTPRVDMIAFDLSDGRDALVALIRRTRLRRVPVFEDDLDHILGVIHAKRLLLTPDAPLRGLVRPVSIVPEAANLERVLVQFRETHRQMAIVVDEYGGTAGLLSLEDVLEEIVGDIPDMDESPAPPSVQKRGENEYICSGDLSVRDWAEAFGIDLLRGRVSTLGGLVTLLLGRIPREGDSTVFHNLRLTVRAMHGRRVGSIRLELTGGES